MNLTAGDRTAPARSSDLGGVAELAAALERLRGSSASILPWLSQAACEPFLKASGDLTYRRARPIVGSGEKEVRQDFEVCGDLGQDGPFHRFAAALTADLKAAARLLDLDPLPDGFHLNDLIVQRYQPGCGGITPHVDHIRYQGLVAIIVFSGRADFQITADRQGNAARSLPNGPGDLLLMTAPGFDGLQERPFHRLAEVTAPRVILGLRWDLRHGEPWS